MATLSHLPTEVLGRIASLSEGYCLLRLALMSGVHLLSQKLLLSTTAIYFTEYHAEQLTINWPKGVSKFRNLETLSLVYDRNVWVQGIDLLQLSSLSKTIKHLTFRFDNASVCWIVRNEIPTSTGSCSPFSHSYSTSPPSYTSPVLILLKDALPNLETLTLVEPRRTGIHSHLEDSSPIWSPQLIYHFVSNLPSRLRRLECDFGQVLRRKVFDLLPPLLLGVPPECLQEPCDVSGFALESTVVDTLVDDSSMLGHDQISVTPLMGLTTIRLGTAILQDVSILPRTVTVLQVHSIVQAKAEKFLPEFLCELKVRVECSFTSRLQFHGLPRTLRKLSIASLVDRSEFSGLPETLLSFSLRMFTFPGTDPIDWNTLPRGLKSLKLRLPMITAPLRALPQKLEKLFLFVGDCVLTRTDISQLLPTSITQLAANFDFNLGENEICALQTRLPQLTKLVARASIIKDKDLALLSRSLTHFDPLSIAFSGQLLPTRMDKFDSESIYACIRSQLPEKLAQSCKLEMIAHQPQRMSMNSYFQKQKPPNILIHLAPRWNYPDGLENLDTYESMVHSMPSYSKFLAAVTDRWIPARKNLTHFVSPYATAVEASQFDANELETVGANLSATALETFNKGGFSHLKTLVLQSVPADFDLLPMTLTSLSILDPTFMMAPQGRPPIGLRTLRMPRTSLLLNSLSSVLVPTLTELWFNSLKIPEPLDLVTSLPTQMKAFDLSKALASFVAKSAPKCAVQIGPFHLPMCPFWSARNAEGHPSENAWLWNQVRRIDVGSGEGTFEHIQLPNTSTCVYPEDAPSFDALKLAVSCDWNEEAMEQISRSDVLDLTLVFEDPVPTSSLSHLPKTLTRLHLTSSHSGDALPFGSAEIPSFLPKCLVDLWISSHRWNVASYTALPRGLHTLGLTHDKKQWSQKKSAALPQNLTKLTLFSVALADDHLKDLPRGLTYLSLPESHELTRNCIQYLPPKLFLLSLPLHAVDLILPYLPTSIRVVYQYSIMYPKCCVVRA